MQTSLSAKLLEMIDPKTAKACQLSSMYNRYNNFDPFTSALLSVTGLADANGNVIYGSTNGVSSRALEEINECMQARQLSRNLSTMARVYDTNYDSSPQYRRSTISESDGYVSPFQRTSNEVRDDRDIYRSTISQYGFQDDMMSKNLGTDIEGSRVTAQMRNQFSEVQDNPNRLQDFSAETSLNVRYLRKINDDRLKTNMYVRDSLQQTLNEYGS
jgi:hypothetical protein